MNGSVSPMLQVTINKMTGDMNFVGIFYIIVGVLYSLTIIGAILGIPLIICGLRLRESSTSFTSYVVTNDESMLERALERQSRFFFIQKVFMIITLVVFVIYIIIFLIFGIAIINQLQSGNYYNV